jgi:hypothetical protein
MDDGAAQVSILAAVGGVAGTALMWIGGAERSTRKGRTAPGAEAASSQEATGRVVRVGDVLLYVLVVEGVVITVLWVADVFGPLVRVISITIFVITLLAILGTGRLLRHRIRRRS